MEQKNPVVVASLSNLNRIDLPEHMHNEVKQLYGKDVQPYYYWGNIHDDIATHGYHPFRDGTHIHTSYVLNEYERDGERYIQTMNTLYKVRPDVGSTN